MSGAVLQTMFVLLFPARVAQPFTGFGDSPGGTGELPPGDAQARMDQLREVETALLGRQYLDSRRMARWPLGRVRLPTAADGTAPGHADVFLITHTSGAGLWECWIPAPARPLDAARYVTWLWPAADGSPAAVLREYVTGGGGPVPSPAGDREGFAFTILRTGGDRPPLGELVAAQGGDLVRLLYRDRSSLAFKDEVIEEELRRDFCLRDGGISLLSARGALDLRTGEGLAAGPGGSPVLPPRSALPLLITIELLLIEREVLRLFHGRLVHTDVPGSLPSLLDLKTDVLDGLEEYRGTVAESNRFSARVTAYGEQVLGLDSLYRSLTERLDGLTFEITTRYQRATNALQFALTLVLGALEAASVAAVIAAARYGPRLLPMAAWAAGAGLAAAGAITVMLRRRLR